MNFGIYKTCLNMLKDQLSLPLLGIYFTFASKGRRLKGDLISSSLVVSKTVNPTL